MSKFLSAAGAAALLVSPALAAENPLLERWTGPYGGVPPFDAVKLEHFKPALEAGMAEQLAEIDKIATDPAAPSFENTIAALERAGRTLDRVTTFYGVYTSTLSSPEFQAIEKEMAPQLAAFSDQITQNEKLFARIAAVYEARERSEAHARAEAPRLGRLHELRARRREARRGRQEAALGDQPAPGRAVHELQPERARATRPTTCSTSTSEAELAGLPESIRSGAAAAAEARGHKGKWAILNTRSQHGAVPDLLRPPRAAREGLAHVLQPRRQRRRQGQQQDHHRDPASCAPSARGCSATRPTPTGGSRTRWPGRPSAAMELMEAVWPAGRGARAGGGRRHAGDRRQGGRRGSRSSPGTIATTPRRSARRSTTSTRTR